MKSFSISSCKFLAYDIIYLSFQFLFSFFYRRLIQYSPNRRATPSELVHHPYLYSTDETEPAAKVSASRSSADGTDPSSSQQAPEMAVSVDRAPMPATVREETGQVRQAL